MNPQDPNQGGMPAGDQTDQPGPSPVADPAAEQSVPEAPVAPEVPPMETPQQPVNPDPTGGTPMV